MAMALGPISPARSAMASRLRATSATLAPALPARRPAALFRPVRRPRPCRADSRGCLAELAGAALALRLRDHRYAAGGQRRDRDPRSRSDTGPARRWWTHRSADGPDRAERDGRWHCRGDLSAL